MKTVWITGASSGIGYALAEMLAQKNYHVIATARNLTALKTLASQYANVTALAADLTASEDVEKLRGYFHLQQKAVDIVIVNAGTCLYMDKGRLDMPTIEKVFGVNVFAAANTVDIALPWLKKSAGGGHIIGISSMTVYLPFTRAEYYGASKAAFTYYLQSLAIDLKPSGIDVSLVFPGFIDTPLTRKNDFSMPFIMSAESAARKIERVIKKRPKTAAFPKPLHIILRILGYMPMLWHYLHRAQTSQEKNE